MALVTDGHLEDDAIHVEVVQSGGQGNKLISEGGIVLLKTVGERRAQPTAGLVNQSDRRGVGLVVAGVIDREGLQNPINRNKTSCGGGRVISQGKSQTASQHPLSGGADNLVR